MLIAAITVIVTVVIVITTTNIAVILTTVMMMVVLMVVVMMKTAFLIVSCPSVGEFSLRKGVRPVGLGAKGSKHPKPSLRQTT